MYTLANDGDQDVKRNTPSAMVEIQTMLKDPAASRWLKQAASDLMRRDIVDASADVAWLARVIDKRMKEIRQ